MTVCIAGKNSIAIECLKYLVQNYPDVEVVALVNRTDGGVDTWQPSYKLFCINNNIKVVSLTQLYNIPDLVFISIEYDTLIKVRNFATTKLYNIHFSKLPAYKGMYTSTWPLLNGETTSGVTLHIIDDGIDTGAIIAQIPFDIDAQTTCRDLYFNYMLYGTRLFKENVHHLLTDNFDAAEQSSLENSYYSKKSIDFQNIKIDLNKTANEIHNQVRAFSFREYQLPVIHGKRIYKSEILPVKSAFKCQKVFQNEEYMIIDTIDFQVKLFIEQ